MYGNLHQSLFPLIRQNNSTQFKQFNNSKQFIIHAWGLGDELYLNLMVMGTQPTVGTGKEIEMGLAMKRGLLEKR